MEDIYKLINADESVMGIDENENLLPENEPEEEEKETEDIKEKDHPRNTKIITHNYTTFHHKENKNLGIVKQAPFLNNQINPNSSENVTTCNISKYMDIQQCLKENYFVNLFNAAQNNIGKKDIGVVCAIASTDNRFFPFDKYFRINKKFEKEKFTKKDIVYYNNNQIKMTNSIVFFLNNFYKKREFFIFDTKLNNERPITVYYINILYIKKIFSLVIIFFKFVYLIMKNKLLSKFLLRIKINIFFLKIFLFFINI